MNLLGAVTKGWLVSSAILAATCLAGRLPLFLAPAATSRWRAIAAPQGLGMDRAPPPKDAGTARPELGAGLPRARPRDSDFSGPDFRFLTVRGRAALAEELLPPAVDCATRARGRLAPRHRCWERRPADHAALHRTGPERLVRGQARLPASFADCVRAALRAHPPGLHYAAYPAQRRSCLARHRARLVLRADLGADLRADCVDRAGPDCPVTRPGQGPGPVG